MSERAREAITSTHPHLANIVGEIGTLRLCRRRKFSIPEAVSRTVISQMLSATSAKTMRDRAAQMAAAQSLEGISALSYGSLRKCGLSKVKAKTITQFAEAYGSEPSRYEAWRTHPKEILFAEVNKLFGLSNWSASILGIFYFGNPDIFPENDGSIRRAVELLARCVSVSKGTAIVRTELCQPYRSYLALYLWRMLDDGILARESNMVAEKNVHSRKS